MRPVLMRLRVLMASWFFFLNPDGASLLSQFEEKLGNNIHDANLPSRSHYETFEEEIHDGLMEAETLLHVVSVAEEKRQTQS